MGNRCERMRFKSRRPHDGRCECEENRRRLDWGIAGSTEIPIDSNLSLAAIRQRSGEISVVQNGQDEMHFGIDKVAPKM